MHNFIIQKSSKVFIHKLLIAYNNLIIQTNNFKMYLKNNHIQRDSYNNITYYFIDQFIIDNTFYHHDNKCNKKYLTNF